MNCLALDNRRRRMKPADAEEFTQSLGQIFSGSWRQIAWAQKQGIPKALGLTTEQWVRDRLGGYVKMSIEDRREAVAKLTDEAHGLPISRGSTLAQRGRNARKIPMKSMPF